jgi:hypothetical protein
VSEVKDYSKMSSAVRERFEDDESIQIRDLLNNLFVEYRVNSVSSLSENFVVCVHICNFKLSGHGSNVKLLFGILFDHLSLEDCKDKRSFRFNW